MDNCTDHKVKVISIVTETLGSLDWELPREVSDMIDKLPQQAQDEILGRVEALTHGHAQMLVGSLHMGALIPTVLEYIRENDHATNLVLRDFAHSLK